MSSKEDTEAFLLSMEALTELLKKNPKLFHTPSYSFLKSFVEHFGGKIPENDAQKKDEADMDWQSEESDLELDMTGVIKSEPELDPPQEMGDPSREPTEEEIEKSQEKRSEAVAAFVEKDYQKAIDIYTEAIVLNPQAALLYAKRGQIYLLLEKPNACIKDCNRALELNADSAAGHKFRGRAYQLLGQFEKAAVDLRLACKFDFDEQADEWLREVTPNARKIEEHQRKKERKVLERNAKKSAKSKADKAKSQESPRNQSESTPSAGNPFGKFNIGDLFSAVQNNPELAEIFTDLKANPQNLTKHMTNPKVMEFISSLSKGDSAPKPAAEPKKSEDTKSKTESDKSPTDCPFGGDMGSGFKDDIIKACMNDPEIYKAYLDVAENPQNITKYITNPKIMEFLASLKNSKCPPGNQKPQTKSPGDDVELD